MNTYKLTMSGMHCMNGCVKAVKEELSQLSSVEIIDVRINEATIRTESSKQPEIRSAIEEAGFQLLTIEPVN